MARRSVQWLAVAVALAGAAAAPAAPTTELASTRPGSRLLAITTLSGGGALPGNCLTPIIQSVRIDPQRATPAARRSLAWLASDAPLAGERRWSDGDGIVVRFTVDRASVDRLEMADDNGNGRPDLVDAVTQGVARAQRLLSVQLDLPDPGPVEVVFARLGSGVDGLAAGASGRSGRNQIWLDPNGRGGAIALRRAAEHQYAHLVAAVSGLDPAWGESLATWAAMTLEGGPDERTAASITHRLAASGAGLVTDDLDLASGNAAWLAFLEETDGSTAVSVLVDELGRGGSDQAALDRALRRAAGQTLDEGLREFQLWSLLTGVRDDRRHFSFASRLGAPAFAATADALPVFSVQADPEISGLGSAAILVRPAERTGGLNVRFEGDLGARWGVDLLLVRTDGSMHRVPLAIDPDQSAELTVPNQDLREAILLVRNLEPEGRSPKRYTWGAQVEPGYPVEVDEIRAEATGPSGVRVSWQTSGERELLGFNVLRARDDDAPLTRINPVWIPAVGGVDGPAAYTFVDSDVEAGVTYRYRIEAVTPEGLTSRSDAAVLAPLP